MGCITGRDTIESGETTRIYVHYPDADPSGPLTDWEHDPALTETLRGMREANGVTHQIEAHRIKSPEGGQLIVISRTQ